MINKSGRLNLPLVQFFNSKKIFAEGWEINNLEATEYNGWGNIHFFIVQITSVSENAFILLTFIKQKNPQSSL